MCRNLKLIAPFVFLFVNLAFPAKSAEPPNLVTAVGYGYDFSGKIIEVDFPKARVDKLSRHCLDILAQGIVTSFNEFKYFNRRVPDWNVKSKHNDVLTFGYEVEDGKSFTETTPWDTFQDPKDLERYSEMWFESANENRRTELATAERIENAIVSALIDGRLSQPANAEALSVAVNYVSGTFRLTHSAMGLSRYHTAAGAFNQCAIRVQKENPNRYIKNN